MFHLFNICNQAQSENVYLYYFSGADGFSKILNQRNQNLSIYIATIVPGYCTNSTSSFYLSERASWWCYVRGELAVEIDNINGHVPGGPKKSIQRTGEMYLDISMSIFDQLLESFSEQV